MYWINSFPNNIIVYVIYKVYAIYTDTVCFSDNLLTILKDI